MTNHPNRNDIYKQHEAAFVHVSAFVVVKGGERVATVAFKYPRDGAGRLYAYVHWLGCPMVRGWANGYGYNKTAADRRGAAVSVAAKLLTAKFELQGPIVPDEARIRREFAAALELDDGFGWDRHLRDAGFEVWQAV